MSDIEVIRARHVVAHAPYYQPDNPSVCEYDRQHWPCDTAVVLAALDEFIERYDRTIAAGAEISKQSLRVMRERDAARADADRLAECLDGHRECRMWGSTDDAVLRQHEEATR